MNKNEDKREVYYLKRLRNYGKQFKWFHWDSIELVLNLIYTYDVLSNRLSKILLPTGLSRSTFNVLNIICRSEKKGCTHKDLSDLLLVSRANVTGLIDNLVRRNLVRREYSKKDRRLSIVVLTSEGEKLIKSVLPLYYKEIRTLVSVLTPGEMTELDRLLNKIRSNVFNLQKN